MNKQNLKMIDDIFISVEAEVPDSLKARLLEIPQNIRPSNFWDWSWGLPVIFLFPPIIWLFVKNSAVIGVFVLKIVKFLMNLPIPQFSPEILLIILGVATVLIGLGVTLFLLAGEQMEYHDIGKKVTSFQS